MSNEERVLRKGDSTVGYPLSPRPDSLYQSVLGIPGVKGPWTEGTLENGYMRRSVEFGRAWIEEQSGHECPTLIIPAAMRHSLWPITMPAWHGRFKVHCPEPGEQFGSTAVPMLVAPSVERPLWKVVFTDAIGEEKAPKPRVSEDPARESGLCIGGPLRGRYFSCAPKGYRTSVELLEKTSYVFFLHEATIAGPMNAMYMLRECYGKPKKPQPDQPGPTLAEAASESPLAGAAKLGGKPTAQCCFCKFWKQTSNTKGQCGLTDADARITRIASSPACWCFVRKPEEKPKPTFESAKDICQDCACLNPTDGKTCWHADRRTTHRVIAACTHFDRAPPEPIETKAEATLNALCWECVSWAQMKPGPLRDSTEGRCESTASSVEYSRAVRKRCMAFEARDDATAIKLANGETCGNCDMWQFADVTKETGRCLRLSGSIWYSSAVPACDNFKPKP